MEIKFDGKRVLVTGAASGIGRGIATELAKCGAKVIALDMSKDQLTKLKEEMPSIETVNVDLNEWKATEEAVKSVCPVDLLVNNAGQGQSLPLTEVTEAHYNKTFNVNIKALINVTRVVVEDLIDRGSPGAIVNISSQASLAALPNHTLYCASKAAVDGFTRAVALDYGSKKIRINAVNPTVVMTELGRRFWSDPALSRPMLAKIPLGRCFNISSQASLAALPNHTLYCASKAAVDGFTRAVALDYGSKKIRINAVNPTVVMTELGRRFWSDPALSQPMLAKIPLGRFGEVTDVVAAVLFLLSDHASLISGITFPVDGGFLAC